jgi:hypothetical protein
VCRDFLAENRLVAVVRTVDNKKAEAEVKLLVGCAEDEIAIVDLFFNGDLYGSAIIVRRGQGGTN